MGIGAMIGAAAAGSAISTGLNAATSFGLAKYQNQLAIQNWKMQNEYNSPKNQMARFAEAGLNPNLIYGSGNPGNASSAPDAAHVGQVEFQDLQLANLLMQYKSNKADVDLKKQQLENYQIQANFNQINSRFRQIELDGAMAYMADLVGTKDFNLLGFGRTFDDQELKLLRKSPTYLKLERQKADLDQADQMIKILSSKSSIFGYQAENMKDVNNLLHFNFDGFDNLGGALNAIFRFIMALSNVRSINY